MLEPKLLKRCFSFSLIILCLFAALGVVPFEAQAKKTLSKKQQALEYYRKGRVAQSNQQYEKAMGFFRNAAHLNRFYKEAFFEIGNCKYKLKRYPSAAASYHRAVEISPNYVDALFGLGKAYLRGYNIGGAKMIQEKLESVNYNYAYKLDTYIQEGPDFIEY